MNIIVVLPVENSAGYLLSVNFEEKQFEFLSFFPTFLMQKNMGYFFTTKGISNALDFTLGFLSPINDLSLFSYVISENRWYSNAMVSAVSLGNPNQIKFLPRGGEDKKDLLLVARPGHGHDFIGFQNVDEQYYWNPMITHSLLHGSVISGQAQNDVPFHFPKLAQLIADGNPHILHELEKSWKYADSLFLDFESKTCAHIYFSARYEISCIIFEDSIPRIVSKCDLSSILVQQELKFCSAVTCWNSQKMYKNVLMILTESHWYVIDFSSPKAKIIFVTYDSKLDRVLENFRASKATLVVRDMSDFHEKPVNESLKESCIYLLISAPDSAGITNLSKVEVNYTSSSLFAAASLISHSQKFSIRMNNNPRQTSPSLRDNQLPFVLHDFESLAGIMKSASLFSPILNQNPLSYTDQFRAESIKWFADNCARIVAKSNEDQKVDPGKKAFWDLHVKQLTDLPKPEVTIKYQHQEFSFPLDGKMQGSFFVMTLRFILTRERSLKPHSEDPEDKKTSFLNLHDFNRMLSDYATKQIQSNVPVDQLEETILTLCTAKNACHVASQIVRGGVCDIYPEDHHIRKQLLHWSLGYLES